MTGDRYRRDDTPTQHQRMPRLAAAPSSMFIELTCAQSGAVSRAQAIELSLTPGQIEAMLAARRWQSYLPGVYLTFTGPVPPASRIWGALLYAGEGATASLETAAWLWGLRGDLPARIDMCVPHGRRVFDQPGLRIASRRHLAAKRHPAKLPARTRIEDTVLDLIGQTARADVVVALLTGACQRRLTTAAKLARAAGRRKRLRWRRLLAEVLGDVTDGVQSALERRYYRLERAHRLPAGTRNHVEGPRGRHRYRDVGYDGFCTVVELDGNAVHPSEDRQLDRARDNEVAENTRVTLRYGWASVVGAPCATAAQVGRVLASRGWRGRMRPCGPRCPAAAVS